MPKARITINGVSHKVKKSHAKLFRDTGTGPVADLVAPHMAMHTAAVKASAADPSAAVPAAPVVTIDIPKKDRTWQVPRADQYPGAKNAMKASRRYLRDLGFGPLIGKD